MGSEVGRSVLILGSYRQTLVALRSLERCGAAVLLGQAHGQDSPIRFSNAVDDVWRHPPLEEPPAFLAALQQLADERGPLYVLPIGDYDTIFLARHHTRIKNCIFCMPDPDTILLCLDKLKMCELAARAEVPVPATFTVRSYADARAAFQTLAGPCAVKPRSSLDPALIRKALFVEDERDLSGLILDGKREVLFQRKIPGLRYNVDFAAKNGRIEAMLHSRVLRVDSSDYSGVAVDALSLPPVPKLTRYSEKMAAATNYTGIGLLQFLHHPEEDEYYFLELNARLGAPSACAFYSGFDLPRFALRLSDGSPLAPLYPLHFKSGVRCDWLTGDLYGLLHSFNHKEIGAKRAVGWLAASLGSFLHASCHSTWRTNDPLPAIVGLGRVLLSLAQRLVSLGVTSPQRPRALKS